MKNRVSLFRHLRFLFILLLLTEASFFMYAEGKTQQKLQWKKDANVLEYKVHVQNTQTGEKKIFTTEANFVNVTLAPGKYRYKIVAYDFLGREGSSSDWLTFEVVKAAVPKVVPPETAAISADEKTLVLPIEATDVSKDTKVYIVTSPDSEMMVNSPATTACFLSFSRSAAAFSSRLRLSTLSKSARV